MTKETNKKPLCGEFADFLIELEELRKLLSSSLDERDIFQSKDDVFAAVRFFPAKYAKGWNDFIKNHDFHCWIKFDLSKTNLENLELLYSQLEDLSFEKDHDYLTKLPNRRFFERVFEIELQRHERYHFELSLISFDLDHFKKVNDSYGHACGDMVLKRLAQHLLYSKRAYDIAARVGGEEFVLLLPGASSMRAKTIAQRILEEFREEIFHTDDGTAFNVTFSAGIASIKDGVNDCLQELMKQADEALYEAKSTGRNKVLVSSSKGPLASNCMVHNHEKDFLFSGALNNKK